MRRDKISLQKEFDFIFDNALIQTFDKLPTVICALYCPAKSPHQTGGKGGKRVMFEGFMTILHFLLREIENLPEI